MEAVEARAALQFDLKWGIDRFDLSCNCEAIPIDQRANSATTRSEIKSQVAGTLLSSPRYVILKFINLDQVRGGGCDLGGCTRTLKTRASENGMIVPQAALADGESGRLRRDWVGTLNVEILKNTSPELAIKIAYDFGRSLRMKEADASNLPALLNKWVTVPFEDNPLKKYIKAGFLAGFNFQPLPWKRQIEEFRSGDP